MARRASRLWPGLPAARRCPGSWALFHLFSAGTAAVFGQGNGLVALLFWVLIAWGGSRRG